MRNLCNLILSGRFISKLKKKMTISLAVRKIFKQFSRKFNTKGISASVSELLSSKPEGDTKTVNGWVKSVRKMKDTVFVDVSDGSCHDFLQIASPKEICPKSLQWGSSICATGKIQINPRGQLELAADKMTLVGKFDVTDDYPFTPKQKQSNDYYRQYLHFRPQLRHFGSLLRFRSAASQRIHQYFNENGFTEIHTPVITSNNCEGAAEAFAVMPQSEKLIKAMKKENSSNLSAFFDSPAFLTESGQLHLEAVTRGLSKVYTFNPTFRAENSKSRLHLSEFYMIEAEEAFVTDLKDILMRIEDCIKQVSSYLLSNYSREVESILHHNETDVSQHMRVLENIINKPFSVMRFSEAKALIERNRNKVEMSSEDSPHNLTKREEIFLVKTNDYVPVFVVDWPKNEKPFYMKECDDDHNLVQGVDLLVSNVGELCGGSIREDNYDLLKKKLNDMNLLDSMEWYLNLRKFGNVPTGGFGMGFERFIMFLLNFGNIKDTIPFPRWPHGLQL